VLALRDLQQFVVLAEELNFRPAAERLLISQPTLTQTLQRLERQLATTLVERSTRKSHLTEAGEALLQGAALLLEDARRLQEEVLSVGAGMRRQLRVGSVDPAMREPVPGVSSAPFPPVGPRIRSARLCPPAVGTPHGCGRCPRRAPARRASAVGGHRR
jgi:DNA-binding transcriptional LysR family regulator